jgi:hypothetical protein
MLPQPVPSQKGKEKSDTHLLPLFMSITKIRPSPLYYFLFAHIHGMNFCIKKPDEAHDPLAIGLFGPVRIVVITENLSDLIHEFQIRLGRILACFS